MLSEFDQIMRSDMGRAIDSCERNKNLRFATVTYVVKQDMMMQKKRFYLHKTQGDSKHTVHYRRGIDMRIYLRR